MKAISSFAPALVLPLLAALCAGCQKNETAEGGPAQRAARDSANAVQDSRLDGVQVPVWKESDVVKPVEKVVNRMVVLLQKLAFFAGPTPCKYVCSEEQAEPSMGLRGAMYYEFTSHRSSFVYTNLAERVQNTPIGARATDRSGRLLAEAKSLRALTNQQGRFQGVEIAEYHYGPGGELIFKCVSQIDYQGFKTRETSAIGRKRADYFFVWPTLGSP